MGHVCIFVVLTQGANDAAVEGYFRGEVRQMQMT